MPPTFDLQSHSIHSDGALPAADVIAHAAAAGTELVALTDHDTIDGVPEARAAAAHHGIAFSAAAELSAVHGAHEDLHILGYGLDDSDEELKATLHDFRGDRARRIGEMADRLRGRPSRRRSRSSTRPAASPSGRTRSGTSTGSTRRSPPCRNSPTPGSTGSRPSTRRTARRRRACCTRRPLRAGC
jgi:hypothetical protein